MEEDDIDPAYIPPPQMDDFQPANVMEQALPSGGPRWHRVTPSRPTQVVDGRQIPRQVLRSRGVSYSREPPEQFNVENPPNFTEDQRLWQRQRSTVRDEEMRTGWPTPDKITCAYVIFLIVLAIFLLFLYGLTHPPPPMNSTNYRIHPRLSVVNV